MAAEIVSQAINRHTASVHEVDGPDQYNLRLSNRSFSDEGLRDFSRSAVIGEYGQAATLLFAQQALSVAVMLDFDRYCRDIGVPVMPKNRKRPDYAAITTGGDYVLIESKATCGDGLDVRSLRKGLEQCDSGAGHLTASGKQGPRASYAVRTAFRLATELENTGLVFADPPGEAQGERPDMAAALATYYAEAFRGLGGRGLDGGIPRAAADYQPGPMIAGRRTVTLVDLPELPQGMYVPSQAPVSASRYRFGVDAETLAALSDADAAGYFQEIDQVARAFLRPIYLRSPRSSDIQLETFADGTFVEISWA